MCDWRVISSSFLVFLLVSCGSPEKSDYRSEILLKRKEINKEMASKGSPIPESDRRSFAGLNFYSPDSSYRVMANFELLANGEVFKMKTNTEREPLYQKYARLSFQLNGQSHNLIAYKSVEHEGNELFIPFNDATNGNETYETGRFMDVEIPEGNSLLLDFNLCYNPYCAYNTKYSCPIPPQENNLETSIQAGEKKFRISH